MSLRFVAAGTILLLIVACQPDADRSATGPIAASRSGALSNELASPGWQATTAQLVAQAAFTPLAAARAYSLVGVAQYWAVQDAENRDGDDDRDGDDAKNEEEHDGRGRGRRDADRGAVAGASAVVLSYLLPTQAATVENMVTDQRNAARNPDAFARGEAVGRAAGAEIVARGQTDGFTNPFTGTIPTGPGLWISNTNPPTIASGQLPGMRPWFLTSANQFRPGPPPAFGSPDFLAGLAEIRQISDTRTAEQTQIAAYWAMNAGTPTASGYWMGVASDNILARGFSERRATHVYALLGTTMLDALIGCWDAKETYWLIRPWQADPAIVVLPAVTKPNHPSYPSGHSCVSSSGGAILGAVFPSQRDQFDAWVTEAGLSRMYGGIHYRFDIEAGQQLGRNVAGFTLDEDRTHNSVLTRERKKKHEGGERDR